ncbi:hypothetical protein TNCV_2882261 [Trichonephila clavipes]|nr:hypothetical protein TNCV_2882261 [Trichonephila clavipes]
MINGRTRLHVVVNGTMTGQRCIDEVLLPHVRLFRGAVDLNPIENVWDALGRQVAGRNYPPTNKNTLIRALTEEWDKLPQQLLDNVVQNFIIKLLLCDGALLVFPLIVLLGFLWGLNGNSFQPTQEESVLMQIGIIYIGRLTFARIAKWTSNARSDRKVKLWALSKGASPLLRSSFSKDKKACLSAVGVRTNSQSQQLYWLIKDISSGIDVGISYHFF